MERNTRKIKRNFARYHWRRKRRKVIHKTERKRTELAWRREWWTLIRTHFINATQQSDRCRGHQVTNPQPGSLAWHLLQITQNILDYYQILHLLDPHNCSKKTMCVGFLCSEDLFSKYSKEDLIDHGGRGNVFSGFHIRDHFPVRPSSLYTTPTRARSCTRACSIINCTVLKKLFFPQVAIKRIPRRNAGFTQDWNGNRILTEAPSGHSGIGCSPAPAGLVPSLLSGGPGAGEARALHWPPLLLQEQEQARPGGRHG